jgi:hypothetical protein
MKSIKSNLKQISRFILDTHCWNPSKAHILYNDYLKEEKPSSKSNTEHMIAALDWIKRAQDITGNDGVAGRYLLNKGWTNSYPETSGHIISSLIKAGYFFNNSEYIDRAKRIVEFLLSVQMDSGAFQGGEYVKSLKQTPAVFNTGQIMLGLIAWYQEKEDEVVLQSLKRSAEWLLSIQEPDGSWEKYTYGGVKPTNYTRVAWPLAVLGKICSEKKYIKSAERFIDWLIAKTAPETGWIDNMGFYKEDHGARRSLTHTMAYAYRGLLEYSLMFNRMDTLKIVSKASQQIIQKFNESGFLSAVYDARWDGLANYSCLTGNCQLSVIWLKLYKHYNNDIFFVAADKVIGQVKSYQKLNSFSEGIRGGIAGSKPIWGGYITNGYPNWAAKFFIDALLLIEQADADLNPKKKDYGFFDKE